MKKILFSAAVLMISVAAFAQTPKQGATRDRAKTAEMRKDNEKFQQLKEEWSSLSPEQRAARKDEFNQYREQAQNRRNERLKNMSPEQRAAFKERAKAHKKNNAGKHDKLKAKAKDMTPEQRAALKARMQERRS